MLGLSTQEFFIQLLEAGGLPALTIGVLFTVFFFWMRSQSKSSQQERESTQLAFKALQDEREEARRREYERDVSLMRAYEELTDKFVDVSSETAITLARLGERISYCPFRDGRAHLVTENQDER